MLRAVALALLLSATSSPTKLDARLARAGGDGVAEVLRRASEREREREALPSREGMMVCMCVRVRERERGYYECVGEEVYGGFRAEGWTGRGEVL